MSQEIASIQEEPIPPPPTEQEIQDFLACSEIKEYSYSLNDRLNEAGLLVTNVINQIYFKNSPFPQSEIPIGQITEMILQGPSTKTPSPVLFQLRDPAEYGRLGFKDVQISVNEPNNILTTKTKNFLLHCNNTGSCFCITLEGSRIDLEDSKFNLLKLNKTQKTQEGGGA